MKRSAKGAIPVIVCAIMLVSCSGHSGAGSQYGADASIRSLRAAGWTVQTGSGMHPIVGGRQLAWLDITAAQGDALSLQFLETGDHAQRELAAATKQSRAFHGETIGNVLVFTRPDGATPVRSAALDRLRALLSH